MFYIQKEGKIILANENKETLENTRKFLPQYSELEIIETDKKVILFDGKYYIEDDPIYLEKITNSEAERLSKLALTKREVFLAIYKNKGITPDEIRAKIKAPSALIEFDYAEKYYRGNPLIDILGEMLGYTKEELDYLFEHKEFLDVK